LRLTFELPDRRVATDLRLNYRQGTCKPRTMRLRLGQNKKPFIHTWPQPGVWKREVKRKAFKRFPVGGTVVITGLKPGVNEGHHFGTLEANGIDGWRTDYR